MDMVHFQTVQFGKKEEIHDLRQSHANVRVSSSVQGTSWRKGKKKGEQGRQREVQRECFDQMQESRMLGEAHRPHQLVHAL